MARGKKTPPEVIYQIMTSWVVTKNYKETAEILGIPLTTVKSIVEKNKDKPEFVELRTKKVNEFSEKASKVIDKAFDRLMKLLENDAVVIPANQLTTVIGTLFDKRALAEGDSTENVTIEIKLPEGCEEYAE